MIAPTIRCPLCDWTYTVPPLPGGVDRDAEMERRLLVHCYTHRLPDWLRKVTALQAQIETQQAELAMLRRETT